MLPVIYPLSGKRVFVAGHRGMVGSALVRRLQKIDCEILTVTHKEVDLRRQAETEAWLAANRPDTVFVAAATVGGILANDTRPGGIPLRQHDDRGESDRGRAPHRREEAAVPRLVLHLSAAGAAADEGRASADRRARADEPMVCDRQDCRAEALRRLSPPARQRLHLGAADQSLRPRRHLRSPGRATSSPPSSPRCIAPR